MKLIKVLAVAVFMLIIGVSFAQNENQSLSKDPNPRMPGLTQKEISAFQGKYRLHLSNTKNMWNSKVLSILSVKEIKLEQAESSFPSYEVKAALSVPAYWDTTDKLVIDNLKIALDYNVEKKKSWVSGLQFAFSVNLKDQGSFNYYFKAYYISDKKVFAGTVTINEKMDGAFILEKIK